MKRYRGIIFDLDKCVICTHIDNPELEGQILIDPKLISLRGRFYQIDLPDYNMKKGSGTNLHMWGVSRPHFNEFLIFCKSYFDFICVWSAGEKKYVDEIVDSVFMDIRPPDLVFTRNDLHVHSNGEYDKPIEKMLNHPILAGKATLENTFFVDDKGDNFISSPGNGIIIPEYKPAPTISSLMSDDICLLQLREWLLRPQNRNAKDVRELDKTQIFLIILNTGMSQIEKNNELKSMYYDLKSPVLISAIA